MSLVRPETPIRLTGMQGQNSSINLRSQNRHSQPFGLRTGKCMGLNGCMYAAYAWVYMYVWLAARHLFAAIYMCVCMSMLDMCMRLSTRIYACMNEVGGYDCETT